MRIEQFVANADIVGHRIAVSWMYSFEAGDTLVALPAVALRRKTRDFEFPARRANDPFGVYDSAAFPPPDTQVAEIDLGAAHGADGNRITTTALSVATTGAQAFEQIRRTRSIETAVDGTVVRVIDTILDLAARRDGLAAGTTYYYELTAADLAVSVLAIATATATHASARMMYEQLPAIHVRHDVSLPPARNTGLVPEAVPVNGQLRRFVDLFGAVADHVRSRAEGLRDIRDVDDVDARMLGHLAAVIGWELDTSQPVPNQRHEIRYAPDLYGLTGSVPGCLAWFKRLSGWDAELHEFWRNVFLSNDLGNPDDPADHGSRSIDTSDPVMMANLRTAADEADYTFDADIGPDHWYAHNVVGFFVTPEPTDTIDDITRRRGTVLASVDRFLPCNLRAVVVVTMPTQPAVNEPVLALTSATDQGE